MKKMFLLVVLSIGIISCKNAEEKQDKSVDVSTTDATSAIPNERLDTYRGDFLFMQDAAVLKGDNFIYGVTINEMSQELAKQVESIKEDEYTMVPVFVTGFVKRKPIGADGWDEILTITEILNVSKVPAKEDIKIEEKKS